MSGSVPTNKLTATEIKKAADVMLARDNRVARQKMLAEQAREKNAGSTVISSNTNPRGRRPARPHRRAPLLKAPETAKNHDVNTAREHAAAELKKRQDAKNETERETRMNAKLEEIKQMLASQAAATQAGSTTQTASASAQANSTSDDGETSEASDTDGDSDIDMPDVASVSDWQSDDDNLAPEGSESGDASPQQAPLFDYGVIVEKNSTTVHKQVTIDTTPAPAMEAEASSVGEDEAPILVDTSATVSEQFDDSEPILAFGPNPAIEAQLSAVVQYEVPLLVHTTVAVTTDNVDPILAFGPNPPMETELSALEAAEQPTIKVPNEAFGSPSIVGNDTVTEESTDLPKPVDDESSAEVVPDDGSGLGSVGSSSIESFDAVGVTDVTGTLRKLFVNMPKLVEDIGVTDTVSSEISEAAPAEEVPKTGSSQKLIEIVEPTNQKAGRKISTITITDEPDFVALMLAMPQGPGVTTESRDFHDKMVSLHVIPLQLPVSSLKTQKTAKKAKKSGETLAIEPVVAEEPAIIHETAGSDVPASVDELAQAYPSNELMEPIVDTSELNLSSAKVIIVTPAAAEDAIVVAKTTADNEPATDVDDVTPEEPMQIDEVPYIVELTPTDEPAQVAVPTVVVTPVDDTPEVIPSINDHIQADVAVDDAVPASPCASIRGRRRSSGHSSATVVSGQASSRGSSAGSNDDLERFAHAATITCLGGVSLHEFVDKLEVESDGTTTKTSICEVFAACSADDTEAIMGKRTDVPTNSETALTQRRTKLGTTSLYEFLRGINFDDEDITMLKNVMRSFRNAAKKSLEPSANIVTAFLQSSSSGSDRGRRSSGSRRAHESDSS